MTYGRLVYEMDRFGSSREIPLQIAYDELEADARSKRAEQTKRASESMQRQAMVRGKVGAF